MSNCEHTETCNCFRLGYEAGLRGCLEIFTADDDVESLLGMPIEDALSEENGWERTLEAILGDKNFQKFMANEFQTQAAYDSDHSVREAFQGAVTKWNAQGEVENAIANAYVHFPRPGGRGGRYHDTLCGENLYWSRVVFLDESDAESMQQAVKQVTCPACQAAL